MWSRVRDWHLASRCDHARIPPFTCVGGANGGKALKRQLKAWCSHQRRTAIINEGELSG
jgi:hypothetical protein